MSRLMNIAATLLLIWGNAAFASDWWFVASDTEGGNFYIDVSSIKIIGRGYRTAWSMSVKKDLSSIAILEQYDCSKGASGLVSHTDYDQSHTFLRSHTVEHVELDPVVPDTIGESAEQVVCSKRPKSALKKMAGLHVADPISDTQSGQSEEPTSEPSGVPAAADGVQNIQ